MSILEKYAGYFLPTYSNYPQGRYISLLLVRQVESEAIFRTEGSGEPLSKEFVHAGRTGDEVIQRVVISKRKQTAVERRTGRELLRKYEMLFPGKRTGVPCALNRNDPCERCMDCMIYGYAAGGGGAQKSRVVTDDAFSLHDAAVVTATKQFNALFDTGTMRDPETRKPSTSIGTDEYVKPETIFLDIETIRDVTADEFLYILGNILRSNRYGAISSRIGKVRNILAGVVFGDCEIFSNLELTQAVYDLLRGDKPEPDFPLRAEKVVDAVRSVTGDLIDRVAGQVAVLPAEEVEALVEEVTAFYKNEEAVKEMLERATAMYGPQE
ncbi:MAG TPA: type I-D CRISPR-associated protein Cas7/Csc2 [Chloroflexi bacterium]|nr:type I-D CRISPR-associated protein Cas7/Csc2 [Chloroflexota bacterium]